MNNATKKEAHPLSWPDGWPRTRPQDRKSQSQWKRSMNDYCEDVVREMERLGAVSLVVSTNIPLNLRNQLTTGVEPLDPGVAVYFSRKAKEDFSWQDGLGIHEPAPTIERIDAAYREMAKKYHPDQGGDIAMFQALTKHRDSARAWVNRKSAGQDYVIACNQFKEVRLNLCAIKLTIAAMRQMERCGTSSLLERAFAGFKQIAEHAGIAL